MKLNEYLMQLSFGELSNLHLGKDDTGEGIQQDKIPKVVNAINEGLLRLYSRFVLKTNSVILETNEVRTRYHLHNSHSWLCADEDDIKNPEFSDKYIRDDPEHPFTNDVIKVLTVTTSGGMRLPLNNHSNRFSVYTPVYDVIEIPHGIENGAFVVVYQARHEPLNYERNPEQEINIPVQLEGALSAYVAYLLYSNMNTQEAIANAQKFYGNYQLIIQENTEMDLTQSSYSQDNTKFRMNGWI